jgi:hypothetical protein
LEDGRFFYAEHGNIKRFNDPKDVVLCCYRLARHYHVDPCIFLGKPLSELARHAFWTNELAIEEREAAEAARQSSD